MIVSRFPFPLEKGDKLRAYYQLRELQKYYDVTLVALTDKEITKTQFAEVDQFCKAVVICRLTFFSKAFHLIRSFVSQRPLQTGYFYSWKAQRQINQLISDNHFDHIYCQLLRTTEYVKNKHSIPKTIDYMDALSAGIKRRVHHQPWYKKWIFRSEGKRLTRYEQHIFDYFEHKVIISEQDRQLIQHPDSKEIATIPNGIASSFFEDIGQDRTFDFVFVGNMSYPPNIEAVHYIVENIIPAFQNSTLLVSGSSPHSSIVNLTKKNNSVTLTGWVDDIRTSYAKGRIFLAPMMIGTGMQNKLLEAMAMKTPCVTTPLANNAIRATHGKEIMVGSTAQEIIEVIRELREDDELAEKIASAGANFVRDHYSWEQSVLELQRLMKS